MQHRFAAARSNEMSSGFRTLVRRSSTTTSTACIAGRGAFVGIDRIRGDAKDDENRVALILGFLEAGYSDRLLLSSDTRRDYGRVARFAKQLQAAGVGDAVLHGIQVDNPRAFLAFVPK
jgi:predicted metal-dependent phosphotriesterase family hydrolase